MPRARARGAAGTKAGARCAATARTLGAIAGVAAALCGCSAVLGIDGSYGDAPSEAGSDASSGATGGDEAAADAPSPDGGGPASPLDAGSSADGASAADAGRAEDAPANGDRDSAPGDAGPASDGEAAAPETDASDAGVTGPVTASRRRLAFGPASSGQATPSVFAIRDDGTVVQWSFGASMTAGPATGVPAATAIAGGTHVCIVAASDQSLWCWGASAPAPAGATPSQIPGTGTGQWTMRGVAVGDTFTCILDDKGTVGCAGSLAGWTSPGNALSYPVFTGGMFASGQLFAASDIAAAGGVMCVVNDSPSAGLFCWGSNAELVAAPTGQLGATQGYPWVVLSVPSDPITVSVAPSHACTTYKKNGAGASQAVCWGAVPEADGGAPEAWDPVPYTDVDAIIAAGAPGAEATFLTGSDGGVWGAGRWPADASAGLLGPSFPGGSAAYVKIPQLAGVQQIATSGTEACALLDDGSVECWGSAGGGVIPPTKVTGLL
jgi:hypothetical protein